MLYTAFLDRNRFPTSNDQRSIFRRTILYKMESQDATRGWGPAPWGRAPSPRPSGLGVTGFARLCCGTPFSLQRSVHHSWLRALPCQV